MFLRVKGYKTPPTEKQRKDDSSNLFLIEKILLDFLGYNFSLQGAFFKIEIRSFAFARNYKKIYYKAVHSVGHLIVVILIRSAHYFGRAELQFVQQAFS